VGRFDSDRALLSRVELDEKFEIIVENILLFLLFNIQPENTQTKIIKKANGLRITNKQELKKL
jgi:hypothetical protein